VTFKDEALSSGVISELSRERELLFGDTIFNVKRLIGRVDTAPIVVRASKNLPFLVHQGHWRSPLCCRISEQYMEIHQSRRSDCNVSGGAKTDD